MLRAILMFDAMIIAAAVASGTAPAALSFTPVQIIAILGNVTTFVVALLAYMKSRATHDLVNSRMDEFKKALAEMAAATIADIRASDAHVEKKPPLPQ